MVPNTVSTLKTSFPGLMTTQDSMDMSLFQDHSTLNHPMRCHSTMSHTLNQPMRCHTTMSHILNPNIPLSLLSHLRLLTILQLLTTRPHPSTLSHLNQTTVTTTTTTTTTMSMLMLMLSTLRRPSSETSQFTTMKLNTALSKRNRSSGGQGMYQRHTSTLRQKSSTKKMWKIGTPPNMRSSTRKST